MARRRNADTAELEGDFPLPGMDIPPDPEPAAPRRRGRPPKAAAAAPVKAAGNRGKIPVRTPAGKMMSKAQQIAKVRAELFLWVSAGVAIWDDRDPECASVMFDQVTVPGADGLTVTDRTSAIVDKLVDMISRNAGTLQFLANSGLVGEAAVIVGLMVPIAKRVWSHHGPAALGHRKPEEAEAYNEAAYPPYAAAAA